MGERQDAGDGAIASIAGGRGKRLMDDVRARTTNLIRAYDERLAALGAEVESAGRGAGGSGFTAPTIALALALLGWLLTVTSRDGGKITSPKPWPVPRPGGKPPTHWPRPGATRT